MANLAVPSGIKSKSAQTNSEFAGKFDSSPVEPSPATLKFIPFQRRDLQNKIIWNSESISLLHRLRWQGVFQSDVDNRIRYDTYHTRWISSPNAEEINFEYLPDPFLCFPKDGFTATPDIKFPLPPPDGIEIGSVIPTDAKKTIRWNKTTPSEKDTKIVWVSNSILDSKLNIKWFVDFIAQPFKLPWQSQQVTDLDKRIIWGKQRFLIVPWSPPFAIEPVEDPEPNPILNIYKVNSMIEVRDSDGNKIDGMSFNISFSLNDFSWNLSASKQEDSSQYLDTNISITINSEIWVFKITEVEKVTKFGRTQYSINGRGLQSLFSEPNELPITFTTSSASLASGIASSLIPSTDAAISWTGVNPNFPSGSWSFTNKTRIQAIRDLAKELGLTIIPNKQDTGFTVQQKHPSGSWFWNQQSVTTVLNLEDLFNITKQKQKIIPYNGVYVTSEVFNNNIFARVTGTNGSIRLNEVISPFIPDTQSAISRGRLELSEANINLTANADYFLSDTDTSLPVGEIILIGNQRWFIESISISVQSLSKRVSQRLTLKGVE